jgi:hypothetical protein
MVHMKVCDLRHIPGAVYWRRKVVCFKSGVAGFFARGASLLRRAMSAMIGFVLLSCGALFAAAGAENGITL